MAINFLSTAREVSRITGSIVSMSLALGPVTRLWTRALYRNVSTANTWDRKLMLSDEAVKEIEFWMEQFDDCQGAPIWKSSPKVDVITYSDAGEPGWRGYCVQVAGYIAKGMWRPEERISSSTWRELKATYMVLLSYISNLGGRTIKHRTDNKNVEYILTTGSRKEKLHKLAVDIYKLCKENHIILIPEWIPREENWLADQMTKNIDYDDYMLHPDLFAMLDILWGPHSVDRFSSFRTRQVPRFNLKWLNPLTEDIDAFTVTWSGENNWIFPPPTLIPKVLRHMESGKEDGTLIAPLWVSAPWWPLLTSDGIKPHSWIIDVEIIPPAENVFIGTGCGYNQLFTEAVQSFGLLALKICFCGHCPSKRRKKRELISRHSNYCE